MDTALGFDGEHARAARLVAITEATRELASEEGAAVRRVRVNGRSWAEIGLVLGVSKHVWHKRFGRFG